MKRDETLQVHAKNGQPLLQITADERPMIVLQADTQVEPSRQALHRRRGD